MYSKAVGEMLVCRLFEEAGLPLCMVRPSIVESAAEWPHAGWIEGVKVMDPIVVGYARG